MMLYNKRIHRLRKTVQLLTFAVFIVIPYLNIKEIYLVVGNLLGFNTLGVPFVDPLSMAQAALGAMSLTQEMLLGAGLILIIAVLLGPVFCSWFCPFGFLSELIYPIYSTPKGTKKENVNLFPYILRCLIVFLGLIGITALISFPILNNLSLPGWITRFWQSLIIFKTTLWIGLIFILLVLIIEFTARKRLWCRYICPQSVLISLAGLLFPKRLRVSFSPQKCTCQASDQLCRKSCSLSLNPRENSLAQKIQCTNCGDCIDACKTRGKALRFSFFNVSLK